MKMFSVLILIESMHSLMEITSLSQRRLAYQLRRESRKRSSVLAMIDQIRNGTHLPITIPVEWFSTPKRESRRRAKFHQHHQARPTTDRIPDI